MTGVMVRNRVCIICGVKWGYGVMGEQIFRDGGVLVML